MCQACGFAGYIYRYQMVVRCDICHGAHSTDNHQKCICELCWAETLRENWVRHVCDQCGAIAHMLNYFTCAHNCPKDFVDNLTETN